MRSNQDRAECVERKNTDVGSGRDGPQPAGATVHCPVLRRPGWIIRI